VRASVALGLEDGKKLRVDTTVVQTDVHHHLNRVHHALGSTPPYRVVLDFDYPHTRL
jgi:hypothetical protein